VHRCSGIIPNAAVATIPGLPASRSPRYAALNGKELLLGLRPEHITEPRRSDRDQNREFAATLDVVEPMDMETMVFFRIDGQEICGRVEPGSAAGPGKPCGSTPTWTTCT
jgi:multiple sugar transport system ATP-binding protein